MDHLANHLKEICIVGSILFLWVLGLGLTLKSGVVHVGTPSGLRRVFANLSQTILLVVVCVLVLAVIQHAIGFHTALM
jgi:hypothetical protein